MQTSNICLLCFAIILLSCSPHWKVASSNVKILSVHVGANPLYGYYATAPVFKVAVSHIHQSFPDSLSNLSHTDIYLAGYNICQDGGDQMASFFMDYYYEDEDELTDEGTYLVLATAECTDQALLLADFARELDLPLLISVAGDSRLDNRHRYPTASALGPFSGSDVLSSVEALLGRFGWRTVSLLCDTLTQSTVLGNFFSGRCTDLKGFFTANRYNWFTQDYDSAMQRDFRGNLLAIKAHSRICLILTTPVFLRQIMIEARKLGMTSGDYVFISIQPTQRPGIEPVTWRGNDSQANDAAAMEAYKSLVVITELVPVWSRIRNLTEEIARTAALEYAFIYSEMDEENDLQIGVYESTMVFAQIFNENYPEVINMTKRDFIAKFANRSFSFAGRNFSTDSTGGKVLPIVVQRLNLLTGLVETAMLFDTVQRQFYDVRPDLWYWAGRNSSPPDVPSCGFIEDSCGAPNSSGIVSGVVIICLIVLLLVSGILIHCLIEKRRALHQLWWLVDRSKLDQNPLQDSALWETTDVGQPTRNAAVEESSHVLLLIGHKGHLLKKPVYVLYVETADSWTVVSLDRNKGFLHILSSLRYLHHTGLAPFVGISLGEKSLAFVSEFEERSKLRDLLDDKDLIVVDKNLRFSMCWDLLEAVAFIHRSSLSYHGNLTSFSCLIDARFSLKVAQTGYSRMYDCLNLSRYSDASPVDLIWKPPEVLRIRTNPSAIPKLANTTHCDMYALGMIFYEIICGNRPHEVAFHIPSSVLETISKLERHSGMQIHYSEEEHFPADLALLLEQCFGREESRPTVRQFRLEFQRMQRRANDVIGHILRRIERHASHLEEIVEERTKALEEEMAIADSLLEQMLPRKIVLLLRNKQPVPPEHFDCVTLMFSDIPAFGNITLNCGALEIIAFLNKTYTLIDEILPEFDVYKVETINDSYVVVSGLPKPNGSAHVVEICRLSLRLLNVTGDIKDPTNPTGSILLRIGLHTGPCVAGVIGSRMPRYCLFGDSMNTASRMESSGEAGRIHVSLAARTKLDKAMANNYGQPFVTESRGQLQVKGKGLMETFWLTSRTA